MDNSICEGMVIVWTKSGGKLFYDINKADKYYNELNDKNIYCRWQRLTNPFFNEGIL